MALTDDLKKAQLWPIKAKGAVERLNPLGDPEIEQQYHKALEQGRFRETSIADAQHWLAQKKSLLTRHLTGLFHMNSLAIDGQLSRTPRAIKFAIDSINILKTVNQYQQEIIGLIQAVTNNIGILQSIEQNMLGMVQQNLNALGNLLHEVCNWGLPDLPAIPNLFSDTIWRWNGFNFFPLASFKPHIGLDLNFSFSQCHIHIPNLNIFRNYPSTVDSYSGLTYGTPLFVPPLGGLLPNTGQDLSDPDFINQMQNIGYATGGVTPGNVVIGPYYNPNTFNVNSMLGSVPDPSTIISKYLMPPTTYADNIISIVPTTRDQVIYPTDPDYNNPNLSVRQPLLRKALVHFVNLHEVVASEFEPHLISAWLLYLDASRTARGGQWLSQLEVAYTQYIQPSVTALQQNPIPWNNVLGGDGVQDSPDLPLIDLIAVSSVESVRTILWKLSYIEASLLGYTRNQTWDEGADANFISSFTHNDLDYRSTLISTDTTTVVLGEGVAESSVPCTFPTSISAVLAQVIDAASTNITNTPTYRSKRPQFRFRYDQFAQATEVDRFSQFWREFNANLQLLLAQDPYLVGFVTTYPEALSSAVDPLGNSFIYDTVKMDTFSRSRTWVPGFPLLNIPKAPVLSVSSNFVPTDGQNGWVGLDLDPTAFLSRPDVQAQPIPIQTAMLRTNLSYAGLVKYQNDLQASIDASIMTSRQLIQDFDSVGFSVESLNAPNVIPPGAQGALVSFDKKDFDLTNNVSNPHTFTIQAAGTYALVGQLEWETGDFGVRTVTVFKGIEPIFTNSTDINVSAPVSLPFTTIDTFEVGDVITVSAMHNLPIAQTLAAGSFFRMVRAVEDTASFTVSSLGGSKTKSFISGSDFPALTAVHMDASNNVIPLNVETVSIDGTGNAVFPFVGGVALTPGTAAGIPVAVALTYGGVFKYPGANFVTGGLIYVGLNGALTQDYATLITQVSWLVCVGRAIADDTFIFEPHIPQRLLLTF
jgi:hypothetical protein